MDICQSVFASFFVRAALGQYELDRPEKLLKLLVDMSRKKLIDRAREEGAARRDYRRTGQREHDVGELAATEPTPSREVAGRELLREFRTRLSDDERLLADQRASGRDWAAISADHGGSPEALRKRLSRAVDRVAREMGLDEGHD
jgi:RNA polymerase sigma-70 factor (ECF subfamily)